ncbi:hypothetical protein RI367_008410 [Sorochytrium milnesiophthora]
MSASSGLTQRRRGGGSAGDLALDAPDSHHSRSQSPASTNSTASAAPTTPSAQSLYSRDRRVAYDPNETILPDEEKKIRLTLMEEMLLLGLKDKQGYLSFWNDSLSYVLRGCILMELALRNRVQVVQNPQRKRFPLPDRPIEAINAKVTGEVLLDETLRLIKQTQEGNVLNSLSGSGGGNGSGGGAPFSNGSGAGSGGMLSTAMARAAGGSGPGPGSGSAPNSSGTQCENWSVATWIDLLSGETWNIMRISYQLRQVRERLAKGLVDKGILRTEKRNFLLFDMPTHPVTDQAAKEEIIQRLLNLLLVPPNSAAWRVTSLRTICLCIAAYAGNVLENVLVRLNLDERERCWARVDELLKEFCKWDDGLVAGDAFSVNGIESNEVVAAVCNVFSKMDILF